MGFNSAFKGLNTDYSAWVTEGNCFRVRPMFVCLFFSFWRNSPQWAMASSFTRFLDHTQRRPQAVRLLWTRDQLVAETSTWQHTTLTTDKYPCPPGGIRTHNLSGRASADPRLRVWLHCSQNRHNTANQHLSGYTLQERVATKLLTTKCVCVVVLYKFCLKVFSFW